MAAHFTVELFGFLAELEENNTREWFNENKDRYLTYVQEPALGFITDFGPRLSLISPHFRADARVQGGSLFRIYRDTRFTADKTPYKTNTGVHFRHERAKDAHAPGFYLHIEPGESFVGVGLWRPETKVAYQIREVIADDTDGWAEAVHGTPFRDRFQLAGDSLQRPPKGFDPDHPHIDDLRRKDFIGMVRLEDQDVISDDFIDRFDGLCQDGSGLMRFLCGAVGVPF